MATAPALPSPPHHPPPRARARGPRPERTGRDGTALPLPEELPPGREAEKRGDGGRAAADPAPYGPQLPALPGPGRRGGCGSEGCARARRDALEAGLVRAALQGQAGDGGCGGGGAGRPTRGPAGAAAALELGLGRRPGGRGGPGWGCPSVSPYSPAHCRLSLQLGELGKGAGKGGGGGGAIREAGGAFGKKQAAEEERYFR